MAQGLILGAYGYDTAGESGADASTFLRPAQHIVDGMENVSTIIPAVILGLSVLFLALYPVTRKRYRALTEQLNNKREGRPWSKQGLERLIK